MPSPGPVGTASAPSARVKPWTRRSSRRGLCVRSSWIIGSFCSGTTAAVNGTGGAVASAWSAAATATPDPHTWGTVSTPKLVVSAMIFCHSVTRPHSRDQAERRGSRGPRPRAPSTCGPCPGSGRIIAGEFCGFIPIARTGGPATDAGGASSRSAAVKAPFKRALSSHDAWMRMTAWVGWCWSWRTRR
jgi:hypothetical protein